MRLAESLGHLNEFSDETDYIQYVSKDDLHQIVKDLTGEEVEAPIEIEDFYYLYDSENEYYYYRPSTPSYYKISSIDSLKKHGAIYTVSCTIVKADHETDADQKNVELTIKKEPENVIYKYRVMNYKVQE